MARLGGVVAFLVLVACGGDDAGNVVPGGEVSITAVTPGEVAGGQPFSIQVSGVGLRAGDTIAVDHVAVDTRFVSGGELEGDVPPQVRGEHGVTVLRGGGESNRLGVNVLNTVPELTLPPDSSIDEEASLDLPIEVYDFDGDTVRIFVEGLPPGARWDEQGRRLSFEPDFIQGGNSWTVSLTASDGIDESSGSFVVTVNDTIAPPEPVITNESIEATRTRLTLSQTTDAYLDSPGYAGRSFEAQVVLPPDASASKTYPVRVYLHGFGGAPITQGAGDQFRIYPHDPDGTYWWGYSDQLPGGSVSAGTVPNYTQRRVLHLVEWLLDNYPGADPHRVYLVGGSMGGAGVLTIGLMHARHFAFVRGDFAQTVPRNHRPTRIAQLSGLWGTPAENLPDGRGMGVWDRQDVTRLLAELPAASHPMLMTKHSKDDTTIHFGAAVTASPLTQHSFYQALQTERVAHYAVWDEGGHGIADPVLGFNWWDSGFDPVSDPLTFVRHNQLHVAFTASSIDDDPGDGSANGNQPWDADGGYAGSVLVAGDTGWNGDLAGALNRYLRWDATTLIDERDRVEVSLWVRSGMGSPPPSPGYPPLGDLLMASVPVSVNVTLRRVQHFVCLPGETVRYDFGSESGTVEAGADGSITVPLSLGISPTLLVLERQGG